MSGVNGRSTEFQPQTYICWGRRIGGETFQSAGVTSGRGLLPGVFHRLRSPRVRKPGRVATAATVRAFEQSVERKILTARRGAGEGDSIQGRCARAGESEESPTKFLLELGRLYSKKLLRPPWGGRGRVGCRRTQQRLVCRFISKWEHQSWSRRFQQTINKVGFRRLWDGVLSASQPKSRGKLSLIASTIFADSTPTWTTYEIHSPDSSTISSTC